MLHKKLTSIFLTVMLLAVSLSFNAQAAEKVKASGTAVVSNVVDGDTYWLRVSDPKALAAVSALTNGKHIRDMKFKVRMLAVNTPESVHRDPSRNTPEGKRISSVVKKELTGQTVTYQCTGAGRYGRALCSISLNGEDYGVSLVRRGMSPYVTKYGRHPWLDAEYRAAEAQAQR